jgi:hypothetical protein
VTPTARDDQDDEDRQVPGERRGSEKGPAPADELDRLIAEVDEGRAVPLDRGLVEEEIVEAEAGDEAFLVLAS